MGQTLRAESNNLTGNCLDCVNTVYYDYIVNIGGSVMGSTERRERERLQVRERILSAARELFASDGYEAVSMRKIASRIEYSAMALYRHFADKETLLRELCLDDFNALRQVLERIRGVSDPVERLRQMGLAYVEFALECPNQYRLLFMTPLPREFHQEKMADVHPEEHTYKALRQTLVEAIAGGRFRPGHDDPDLLSQVFWGGVHGVVALHIVLKDASTIRWCDVRETTRTMLDAILAGIAVPDGAAGHAGLTAE
jgi:AcrR family transcriptional regulator